VAHGLPGRCLGHSEESRGSGRHEESYNVALQEALRIYSEPVGGYVICFSA